MTQVPSIPAGDAGGEAVSTSAPLLPPADLRLRVLPAHLARMLGVSKTAVGKAIATGRITLEPDGRLDPRRATAEWIRNTEPRHLRARVLRGASITSDAMLRRIAELQSEIAALKASEIEWARALRFGFEDEQARRLHRLQTVLVAGLSAFLRKHDLARIERGIARASVARLLDRIVAIHMWDLPAPPDPSIERQASP